MNDKRLLPTLVQRGTICITDGRLEIIPNSGKEVPEDWLRVNKEKVIHEILELLCLDAYQYLGYTTGRYGKGRLFPGVNLSFVNIQSGEQAFAIFNAEIDRAITTKNGKAGTPLPKGQFRVTRRYEFHSFWKRTGLTMPSRRGLFHDYMGNLKPIIFAFEADEKNKASNKTIKPLNVTHDAITQAMPNNVQTSSKQLPNNIQTILPNMELSPAHIPKGIELDLSTCASKYETSKQDRTYTRDCITPITVPKRVEEQSIDEWLADYDRASSLEPRRLN